MNVVHLASCVLICASVVAYADQPLSRKPAESFRETQLRRTGGKIKIPNAQKGRIVIIDSKSGAPRDSLAKIATQFSTEYCIDVSVADGVFRFPNPQVVGNATVFVVDDNTLPMSLVAAENRWAVVNVSPLKHEKKQFFNARVRKETARVLVMLCGGCNSSYPDALTSAVVKPADLDKFPDTRLQLEYHDRMLPYLRSFGIEPYRMTTYRAACEQGWAPAPTNEYQKAIWDKVHAIPKAPMKIEYDPKKGR